MPNCIGVVLGAKGGPRPNRVLSVPRRRAHSAHLRHVQASDANLGRFADAVVRAYVESRFAKAQRDTLCQEHEVCRCSHNRAFPANALSCLSHLLRHTSSKRRINQTASDTAINSRAWPHWRDAVAHRYTSWQAWYVQASHPPASTAR